MATMKSLKPFKKSFYGGWEQKPDLLWAKERMKSETVKAKIQKRG